VHATATTPFVMTRKNGAKSEAAGAIADPVQEVLAALRKMSSRGTREGMARFGIPSENALGVTVADIRKLAKQLGRDHQLAQALWRTGVYEARMLTAFLAEAGRVTPTQMDRWCRDFNSWAICDALCFHLFDRTPHAFVKVHEWSDRRAEFEKRAAFALLAGLAGHDRTTGDEPFLATLPLIERAATDERNFVKKGVSWALRRVGRRSGALNVAAVELAEHLAASANPTARWIGKDALRDITKPNARRNVGD
jgi:3-methyladenine DNA glycosylase AlkD